MLIKTRDLIRDGALTYFSSFLCLLNISILAKTTNQKLVSSFLKGKNNLLKTNRPRYSERRSNNAKGMGAYCKAHLQMGAVI